MDGKATRRATLGGKLTIAVLGLFTIAIGVFTLVEGRDQVCSVVEVIPGIECGPQDDPDRSVLVVVAAFAVSLGVLSVRRRKLIRQWRTGVADGSGQARSSSYWPVSLSRGALLVLTATLLVAFTVRVEPRIDENLGAGPLLLFAAFTLAFAASSTSWTWRRTVQRAVRQVSKTSLAEALAAGGGWCEFEAEVGEPTGGRAPLTAPFAGTTCIAWSVGAEIARTNTYQQRVYETPNDDLNKIIKEIAAKNDRIVSISPNFLHSYTWDLEIREEWKEFVHVTSSNEPFTVQADQTQLVVEAESLDIFPKEQKRPYRVSKRRDAEWYEYIIQMGAESTHGDVTASLGVFCQGDPIKVRGCVFSLDGDWHVASLAASPPDVTQRVPPEMHTDLLAAVVPGRRQWRWPFRRRAKRSPSTT